MGLRKEGGEPITLTVGFLFKDLGEDGTIYRDRRHKKEWKFKAKDNVSFWTFWAIQVETQICKI